MFFYSLSNPFNLSDVNSRRDVATFVNSYPSTLDENSIMPSFTSHLVSKDFRCRVLSILSWQHKLTSVFRAMYYQLNAKGNRSLASHFAAGSADCWRYYCSVLHALLPIRCLLGELHLCDYTYYSILTGKKERRILRNRD
jgi:hypothetical protein